MSPGGAQGAGMEDVKVRLSLLEQSVDELKEQQKFLVAAVNKANFKLDEWATIRRTLGWVGSGLLAIGSAFGWLFHEFWHRS